MPKLKPSANEQMNREVLAALNGGQTRKAMTDASTAKIIGIHKDTYQRHKREPERITLSELRCLVRVLKITDAEILRMVRSET